MCPAYNYKNKSLKATLYFSIFLIVLGLGNIIFGTSRARVYSDVYFKLEALKTTESETALSKFDEEKLDNRLKRAKARMDFYRFVGLGGKSLLVISALLILYCLYYSKDFEKKPVLK